MASFDIASMLAYIEQNPKPFATKAVQEAQTLKMLMAAGAVQFGKGKVAVNTLSQSVTFSDGLSCARVEDSAVAFSQRQIEFVPMKNNKTFCYKELYDTVIATALSKGQSEETLDASVFAAVVDNRAALISKELENLIWKGDTTQTDNRKWFDGYLKLVTADGVALTLTGSDIIAKLQSFAGQVDVIVQEQDDFRVFIGKDTANALQLAIFNGKYFNPGSEGYIPGTNVKYEVVSGLNGTSKAIGMRVSNMRAILDKTGEDTNVKTFFDPRTQDTLIDFYFGLGVQIVFPDQAYIAAV